MANRMTKAELIEWLCEHGVEFPASATVKHLRALYESAEGVNKENEQQSEVNDASSQDGGGSEAAEEERALDSELRILQKKKMIADLRREVAALEITTGKQPEFSDIKYSVRSFSGDDVIDAKKWIDDFEQSCNAVNGDDIFKLKCVRRLMEPGTEAETFLHVDKSTTYTDFKKNFVDNFGHVYSISEVIDKLRRTTFRAAKTSVTGYILKMEEIGSRAKIEETQMVQLIIDGFQDHTADVAILYPAKTIMELKQLSRRYAQLRESRSSRTLAPSTSSSAAKPRIRKPEEVHVKITDSGSGLRCFNCSGIGHYSADCLEPRREKGSCFRCGSTQHKLRDCAKPAPSNKSQVALIDEFRTENQDSVAEGPSGLLSEVNTSD